MGIHSWSSERMKVYSNKQLFLCTSTLSVRQQVDNKMVNSLVEGTSTHSLHSKLVSMGRRQLALIRAEMFPGGLK